MFRSSGLRFIAIGLLTLVMFIPLSLVSDIINDRSRLSDQTVADIEARGVATGGTGFSA